jgi:hypothetical protein
VGRTRGFGVQWGDFWVKTFDRLRNGGSMRNIVTLATVIVLFCFSSLPAFSGQITPKPKGQNEWAMYDENAVFVGTLKRTEEGNFKFYDKGGGYVGLIVEAGRWIPRDSRRSYTSIEPEEARLYLDALKAIETLALPKVKVPGSFE